MCFHGVAATDLTTKLLLFTGMAEKRSSHHSRKECSMFPKQFSLLFNNIFKVEVFKQLQGMTQSNRTGRRGGQGLSPQAGRVEGADRGPPAGTFLALPSVFHKTTTSCKASNLHLADSQVDA